MRRRGAGEATGNDLKTARVAYGSDVTALQEMADDSAQGGGARPPHHAARNLSGTAHEDESRFQAFQVHSASVLTPPEARGVRSDTRRTCTRKEAQHKSTFDCHGAHADVSARPTERQVKALSGAARKRPEVPVPRDTHGIGPSGYRQGKDDHKHQHKCHKSLTTLGAEGDAPCPRVPPGDRQHAALQPVPLV